MARFFEPDEKFGGRDPQKFEEDIQGILEAQGFEAETIDPIMMLISDAIEKRIIENENPNSGVETEIWPAERPRPLHWAAGASNDPDDTECQSLGCHAGCDGDCNWSGCPQLRDGEPVKSGRHCPLDGEGVETPWTRSEDRMPLSDSVWCAVRNIGDDEAAACKRYSAMEWIAECGETFAIAGTEWRPVEG